MLTVIEIHISHLRFNLKVIRIYHILEVGGTRVISQILGATTFYYVI